MKKESKRRSRQKVFEALTMVLQFSLYMIVPIMMCTLIGVWLGKKYDMPIITVPLFIVGALAGFTNIYKMSKKMLKQSGETDK
jgi:F0F1-type ATP synthase assembly protein I